jgi:SAM-dependent methyltransferase
MSPSSLPAPSAGTQQRYREHHAARSRYGFSFGEASRAAVFDRWLGSGKTVLDAGCRDGTLTRHYARNNRVVGCDIDDMALVRGRREFDLRVVNSDLAVGLPFRSEQFDAVVLGEVLEHLPDSDATVLEIRRVLKPGGLFIGSVPNAFRLKNRLLFFAGRDFDTDPTHLHRFSPVTLSRTLRKAGFGRISLAFCESRWLALSGRLFGNTMLWCAHREG